MPADVRVEEIGPIEALATELGVEVEAAGREAAGAEDLVQGKGELVDRVRELVGVPAVLVVAAVRVDAAEDPAGDRHGDLVVEAVAGEGRVVDLDVHPVLAREVVPKQERVDGRRVVVVLVLGGLHRLRLQKQGPAEADLLLVLGDQGQEAGELLLLTREVGVEQRLVALAATPQHVVLASEPMRRLEHVLHLCGGVGEDLGIGVGRRAGGVARVAEQVRGSPQQPGSRALHVALDGCHDRVEHRPRLGERAALRRHVAVVEREERNAELRDELERRVELRARRLHRFATGDEPRPVERADAEDVGSGPVEGVPQAHRDAEVILHALAETTRSGS